MVFRDTAQHNNLLHFFMSYFIFHQHVVCMIKNIRQTCHSCWSRWGLCKYYKPCTSFKKRFYFLSFTWELETKYDYAWYIAITYSLLCKIMINVEFLQSNKIVKSKTYLSFVMVHILNALLFSIEFRRD